MQWLIVYLLKPIMAGQSDSHIRKAENAKAVGAMAGRQLMAGCCNQPAGSWRNCENGNAAGLKISMAISISVKLKENINTNGSRISWHQWLAKK